MDDVVYDEEVSVALVNGRHHHMGRAPNIAVNAVGRVSG